MHLANKLIHDFFLQKSSLWKLLSSTINCISLGTFLSHARNNRNKIVPSLRNKSGKSWESHPIILSEVREKCKGRECIRKRWGDGEVSRCISIIISYTWRGEVELHRWFYHMLRRVYFIVRRDHGFYALLETPGDAIFERDFMACRAALKLYKSVKSRTIKINKSNFLDGILCTRRMSTCTKVFVVPAQCDNQWNFSECKIEIVLMAWITHDRW